jgi:hypothetical protein
VRDGQEAGPSAAAVRPEAPAVTQETAKPVEPGTLPSVPLGAGSDVELASVRVGVADFARGDAAWAALRKASSGNPPPPLGRQYVLVRVRVTGVASASWVGCQQFRIVGANRIVYPPGGQLPPEPALRSDKALQAGAVLEGWCPYSFRSDDRGLILIVDAPDHRNPAPRRYVALEQGASLAPIPSVEGDESAPSNGQTALAPAEPGSEVVTRDWSVKVVDVVRGEDARHLVESANSNNEPPADGLEFVAVKLHARYHGPPGLPGLLSAAQFRVVNSEGKSYDVPLVLDVTPRLTRTLFPGGEHTGWAVFQIGLDDSDAVLRFEPYFPDLERRYLALNDDGERDG